MFAKKAIVSTVAALAAVMSLGSQPAEAAVMGGRVVDRVEAHRSDFYTICLSGGELAMITVSGDGDTDLDLFVWDRFGNLIDSDTDLTDQCVVIFRAPYTGRFRIQIENWGSVYNLYELTIVD